MNLDDLQQAVFDRLTAQVGGDYVGIYDGVAPQSENPGDDAAFPYITVGPMPAIPMETKDQNGAEVVVQVHIWSRSTDKVTRGLAGGVYDAMQRHDLDISWDAEILDCRFAGSEDFPDSDGLTRHIVTRWRITYFMV